MKLICAPDKFKGSLSAVEVAAAMAAGARRAAPNCTIVQLPLADGGEGTVEALIKARAGSLQSVRVLDPLRRSLEASMGDLGDGVFALEMAAASGLVLLRPDEHDPFQAGTFGTGQLISAALDRGAREIILGAGGSATVDAGAGALQALGARLLDEHGSEIGPGNAGLAAIAHVDLSQVDARLSGVAIRIATDVRNPLLGPRGAAAVFGPQKGARAADIQVLDRNLGRFARIVLQDCGVDIASPAGSGAAGGLTAGLLLVGSVMESGIDLILDVTGFDRHLDDADLVLTGEGRIDAQSAEGKVISGVVTRASRAGVTTVALGGSVRGDEVGALHRAGLAAAFPILDAPSSAAKAYARAAPLVRRTAEAVVRLWLSASERGRAIDSAAQVGHQL